MVRSSGKSNARLKTTLAAYPTRFAVEFYFYACSVLVSMRNEISGKDIEMKECISFSESVNSKLRHAQTLFQEFEHIMQESGTFDQ